MTSAKLLEIFNDIVKPSEMLPRLNEAQFGATDITEEGDAVLHVLAKSNHAKNYDFSDYIKVLMAAGANANSVDKQGHCFLGYYLDHTPYYAYKTFNLLLENKDFDINQVPVTGQSFFEFIYNANDFDNKSSFQNLIKHNEFNPNQNTSKHNSTVLHMISENVYSYREELYSVVANPKTNHNIKNKNGQTALAQILSDTQYKNMRLISAIINHEQCDIHALDNDGNNYLQLAILTCEVQGEDIATLLIQKGIDVTHKNKAGKSVFDLILENKAYRSDYANKTLLLAVLELHPSSLFEKYSSGKTILSELLKSQDYTITSELRTLLKLVSHQKDSIEPLKNIISEFFKDFSQKLASEKTLISLTELIADISIDIDVEYCLAVTAIYAGSYQKENIYNRLRKLKPEINLNVVNSHVVDLTKKNSDVQLRALNFLNELEFHLDCFDDVGLAWEEQYLRTKIQTGIDIDSKMFGHLFSLSGMIPINNRFISLTSSSSDYTAQFMGHLMNAYVAHCVSSGKHTEHLDVISQVRNMTIKAMRYYFLSKSWDYYPSLKSAKAKYVSSIIVDSKNSGVEIITGWPKHSVNLIIKQDDFYRNNGGGCSTDATTEHYKLSRPEHLTESVIAKLYSDTNKESNKTYIQRDLHHVLGLMFEGAIPGKFQTVGNCSLESRIIALKIKYRLFLPETIADELFADTRKFFEHFYLEEYLSKYSNHSTLPQLLMRLILQKLIPEEQFELAAKLLKSHFTSEAGLEIIQIAFMLKQWTLRINGDSLDQFNSELETLGVVLNPAMNSRLQMLDRFLNNKVSSEDLEEVKSWPLDKQMFQGYHLLHFAVMNNNVELALSLIQMFPKAVDQTNWFDQEPLYLVKSTAMIDLLINAGASTTRTDYDNALDCAIRANKVDLVRSLLNYGVKPSEYSAYYAASKDPKILQALIEVYPETIKTQTHNYSTAVHAAARNGRSQNLHTLVYYGGANPAVGDVNGVTPLQLALQNGHKDTAKNLIQFPGALFKAPYRGDPVIDMTQDEDLKQTIALKKKERKEDLKHVETFKNSNPGIIEEDIDYLIVAISKNDLPAIRGCLISYPNIKVVNNSKLYHTSPLANAIQNVAGKTGQTYDDALAIVQLLLKTSGIDINAVMASSEPLLFMATSINNVPILELFLADTKLDINKQDNIGYTALHDAVERGHLECVKRLLQDDRIDSTIMNKRQDTAADLVGFKCDTTECCEEVAMHQLRTLKQNIV